MRTACPDASTPLLLSGQHKEDVDIDTLRSGLVNHVILPILPPPDLADDDTQYYIHPTGRFAVGARRGISA